MNSFGHKDTKTMGDTIEEETQAQAKKKSRNSTLSFNI